MGPEGGFSVATAGQNRAMSWLDKLFRREGDVVGESAGGVGVWSTDDEHRANKQQADPGALEVEGDPRGGLQDDGYRSADPRDVVEAEGVAMSGPGGAPVDGSTPDERREDQRA
jgi:hypothetical protein